MLNQTPRDYTRHGFKIDTQNLQLFIKDSFKLSTILTIGALLQTAALTLLPARYALLPAALLAARAVLTTILEARAPTTNPWIHDIVPGRVTAHLPPEDSNEEDNKTIVVFHLGVRVNHPLGLLAPGARELGARFVAMAASLRARRDEYGLLGEVTPWRGQARAANNALLLIAYFSTAEGLNRFAHDEVHRAGWDWYRRFVRETGYQHLGIFHETFVCSRAGGYETIYVDTAPTLLGETSVKVGRAAGGAASSGGGAKDGEGEEAQWLSALVSADHAAFKTQAKRMGLTTGLKEADGEKY